MKRRATQADCPPTKVDSVRRGLEVLRVFRAGEFTLRPADIASKLALPMTTLQGLLDTLVQGGFLRYLPEAQAYEPGAACIEVGQAVRSGMPMLQLAQPLLQGLATRYDITVTIAARERLQMIRLVHCTGESTTKFGVGVGQLLPIASTAMGRAYIWALPPAEQAELLDQIRTQGGEASTRAIAGIYDAFKQLEVRGYCVARTELVKNACAVAVPLNLDRNTPLLSLGAMASGHHNIETLLRGCVGPELLAAAGQIRQGKGEYR